jgi:hypothetical protein
VTCVVLGQDELCPQLLNDPMREVVILKQIYLLSNFGFIEVTIEGAEPSFNIRSFLDNFRFELMSFLRFHKIYDFLGADFRIIDEERILHGVLLDEVEDFYAFYIVLLVDQKVELLPLLCHNIEFSTVEDEVTQGLEDADVDAELVDCSCLFALSFVALEDVFEELGHVCLGVVDAL